MAVLTSVPDLALPSISGVVSDIKAEADTGMPTTSAISAEVRQAVDRVISFGGRYKTLAKEMDTGIRRDIGTLKKAFGIAQGTTGRSLNINGKMMKWDEFCDEYFDLTPHRVNQLLQIHDDKVAGVTPIKRPTRHKTVTLAPPAEEDEEEQDCEASDRFAELEARVEAAEDEKAALEAERKTLLDEADKAEEAAGEYVHAVNGFINYLSTMSPKEVRATLTLVIAALNLTGVLRVEQDDVQ